MPYSDYLMTEHWLSIRAAVIYRASGRCQLCSKEDRLHIHHNSYQNLGQERPEDVIVLCQYCHEKFHDKAGTQGVPASENGANGVVPASGPAADSLLRARRRT